MSKTLKIIPQYLSQSSNVISISKINENFPYLIYKDSNNKTINILCESSRERLIKCSELKQILLDNIYRGTKFIIDNGYSSDRKLYYLNPDQEMNYCNIPGPGYMTLPLILTSTYSKDYPNAFDRGELNNIRSTKSVILSGRSSKNNLDVNNLNPNKEYEIVVMDINTGQLDSKNFETTNDTEVVNLVFFEKENEEDESLYRITLTPNNPGNPETTYKLEKSDISNLIARTLDYSQSVYENLLDDFIEHSVNTYKDIDPDYPFPIRRNDPDEYSKLREYLGSSNYEKEIKNNLGKYTINVLNKSGVFEILSKTTYTDTLDLNFIINKLNCISISAEATVGISYSLSDEKIINLAISFEIFKYIDDEKTIEDLIFDKGLVQVEYFNGIIRVFPKSKEVKECIINNCLVSYGKL